MPMRHVSSAFAYFILSVAATMAVSSASYADGIPAAAIAVSVFQTNNGISTAGTVSSTVCTTGPLGGCESSTATASFGGGVASVSGSGSNSGGSGTDNSGGGSDATFFFEVEGSGPDLTVPLIFTGSASTSASGPNGACQQL